MNLIDAIDDDWCDCKIFVETISNSMAIPCSIHVLLDCPCACDVALQKYHFPSQHRFFTLLRVVELIFYSPNFQYCYVGNFLDCIHLWPLFYRWRSTKDESWTFRCSYCFSTKSLNTYISEAWVHACELNAENTRTTYYKNATERKPHPLGLVDDSTRWCHDRDR